MPPLTDEERATYEWQMWSPGFGEAGQEKLKGASALVSRVGGLGSPIAYQLAASGWGKVVLAHAGNVKPSDLNRQLLMTHDGLGKPRVESAARRLRDLNPRLEVVPVNSNVNEDNAAELVEQVDVVFDAAPLFPERFLMNRECVRQGKPLIDCAMYDLEGQVMVVLPGETACLQCLYPEIPPAWKREFPVFGAVSATAANIGAMEGIKLVSGQGASLAGKLLYYDLRQMTFQVVPVARRPACPVCGGV
jgi:molybdopterin/thiamine biosynthesis adenylyltransferase